MKRYLDDRPMGGSIVLVSDELLMIKKGKRGSYAAYSAT